MNDENLKQFNKWTVIDSNIIKGKIKCRCECGTERMVSKEN